MAILTNKLKEGTEVAEGGIPNEFGASGTTSFIQDESGIQVSPNVQAELDKNPGLTPQAAIGNIESQVERDKATTAATKEAVPTITPQVPAPIDALADQPTTTPQSILSAERQSLLDSFNLKSPEEVKDQVNLQAKSRLDANKAVFREMLERAKQRGRERFGGAVSQRGAFGLAGSGAGGALIEGASRATERDIASVEARQEQENQRILADVEQSVRSNFREERQAQQKKSSLALGFKQEDQDQARLDEQEREAVQAENKKLAKGLMDQLANSGINIKDVPAQTLEKLKEQSGFDDFTFEALYNSKLPQAKQQDIKYETINNRIVGYRFNPETGQLETFQSEPIGELEDNVKYTQKITPDGTLLMIPDQLDPNRPLDEQIKIFGQEGQFAKPTADGSSGFTLSKGQARFDSEGNLIASSLGGDGLVEGVYTEGENKDIDSWVKLMNKGTVLMKDVPKDLKTGVANALSVGGADSNRSRNQALLHKVRAIDSLIDHKGMSISVGSNKLARFTPFKVDTMNGAAKDFVAGIHQLSSKETLDFLIQLKEQGGTLGALNESELEILKNSATKLNDWEIKKDGVGIGKWDVNEESFNNELRKMRQASQVIINNIISDANVSEPASLKSYLTNNPNDLNHADALLKDFPNASPEDILELLQESDFSTDLSTSKNGLDIGSLSEQYESGGDPARIGFDRTGGYSYGKYQLAHNNAKKFIESSPFKNEFNGLKFNSKPWRDRWQEVAKNNPNFGQEQQAYIKKTHFDPQVGKIAQAGFNLDQYSNVLKDVIWSTAVQHGASTDIITKALKKVGGSASEGDLIKAIYSERWSNGRRFASSTDAVKKGVKNRFFGKNGELNNALSQLA